MYRKWISMLLCLMLVVSSMGVAMAAVPETVQDKLAMIERDTYGMEQVGALMERLNKLEKDYNSKNSEGSLMARVDALYDELYKNDKGPSVMAKVNAIEWNIGHAVSMEPVQKRLSDLEMTLNGKTGEGDFQTRISQLSKDSFGNEKLPLTKVLVPADTLIKVALVDPVNAKHLKEGDIIHYQVAEDVVLDGNLLFAKGEPGEGPVTKVRQAQNFGRNAEVEIDFKKTKSLDGTEVDTFVGDEAKEEMKGYAMAAGASLAGVLLLGPIGIIGGAFVKGENVNLPEGTELYIQTLADTELYGVTTTLAR